MANKTATPKKTEQELRIESMHFAMRIAAPDADTIIVNAGKVLAFLKGTNDNK